MQKILNMVTRGGTLRSEAEAWGCEDGDEIKITKDIGLSGPPNFFYAYKYPMFAIANGWKLLGPPKEIDMGLKDKFYEWWFVKD